MAAPRSEYYNSHDNVASPPPGQGHFPSHPDNRTQYDDRYDDRYDRGGQNRGHPQQQQPYFDPPPRDDYQPSVENLREGYPPQHPYAYGQDGYGQGAPHPQDSYASLPREGGRPYESANQLAPYDEEKADAEWRRVVEDAHAYQRPHPPPATDYGTQRQVYDDDLMREQQMEARERERERRYYEEREYRERDRERERRKRRDEEAMKEKALRYPSDPKKGGRDIFGSSEGERGLAATLAGGAGGALIAHEKKAGALGTLGGIVVGALAGTILENQYEKRKERKEYGRREEVPYPGPGRDMDDVRRTGRDGGVIDARGRPSREQSRRGARSSSGFRDRLRRSLSRARSKSRPRRSESYDSDDTHWR